MSVPPQSEHNFLPTHPLPPARLFIQFMITSISTFTFSAQQKTTLPKGRHKIVILDEADAMTEAAQQALRRTMEIYSNTTRFALACNSSEKIIEPIQSRCAMLRYSRLSNPQILAKILDVCDKENIGYTEDGLEAIIFTAQGDMRQGLNNLQVHIVLPR